MAVAVLRGVPRGTARRAAGTLRGSRERQGAAAGNGRGRRAGAQQSGRRRPRAAGQGRPGGRGGFRFAACPGRALAVTWRGPSSANLSLSYFLFFISPPPSPLRMDGPQLVRSTRGGGFSVEVGARARVAALQTESFGRGGGVHTSGLQILGCKGFNDGMRRSVFQNLYKFV